MKRIDTSSITDLIRMPFAAKSLSFLQDSYKEVLDALVKGLVNYTNGTVLVLYGCEVSGSNPYTLSEGAIYYNDGTSDIGEIYLVDPITTPITTTGGQTLVWTKQTSNDALYNGLSVDPVTFTNNLPHSVHDINKFVLLAGDSSTTGYVCDYTSNSVIYYNPIRFSKAIGEVLMYSGSLSSFISGLGTGSWAGFALCDGSNGTPNLSGRFIVGVGTAPDDGTITYAVGDTGGETKHLLVVGEGTIEQHDHIFNGGGGGGGNGPVWLNGATGDQTLSGTYSADAGTGHSHAHDNATVVGGAKDATNKHENRPPYYALAYIMRIA